MRVTLPQQLTYWAPKVDNRYNEQTYELPVVIQGRWEDNAEEIRTPGGDTVTSRAQVYCDRPVGIDGYLVRGDATAFVAPTDVADAWKIIGYMEIPDLRNVQQLRTAFL